METTAQLLERTMMENRRLRAHIRWLEDELGLVVDYLAEAQRDMEHVRDHARERGKGVAGAR